MDEEKFRNRLAGGVRFPEDMTSRKMVHAKLIRAEAHLGILEEIHIPELPEEVLFLQAGDLPGKNIMPLPDCSIPLLAEDEILYPGQPVGLLTGPDPDILYKLSKKIHCTIRRIPAFPPPALEDPRACAGRQQIRKGDLDRGFIKADRLVSGEFSLELPEIPSYPRTGIFCVKEGGRYILHLHTQWPSLVRKFCALAANISRKQVELHFNTAGRSWDTHIWQSAVPAALTVAATSIIRQPVKLMEDPDAFRFTPRKIEMAYKAGIDSQGRLTALKADLQIDAGAYGCFTSEILNRLCTAAAGYYQCRNILIGARAFLSNTPPWFPLTGWGLPQGFFGMEMLANHLAEECGTDPAAWRKQNLVIKGNLLPTSGPVRQDPPLEGMIDSISRKSDFIRKNAAGRQICLNERALDLQPKGYNGIGMAVSYQGNEFLSRDRILTAASVSVTLQKEGDLDITLNAVPASPSLLAVWKKRLADRLSLPEEKIHFILDKADEQTFNGPSTPFTELYDLQQADRTEL